MRNGLVVVGTILAGVAAAALAEERPMREIRFSQSIGPVHADVAERLAQFAPTRVEAPLTRLGPEDRAVLDKLIEAGRQIGQIFLRQSWADNPLIREKLVPAAATDPLHRSALAFFDLNAGPWDRLDEKPFIGEAPRPDGAGFYPPDLTKEEFETWVKAHPADDKAFRGLFTVIRRAEGRSGGLRAEPYSRAYATWLAPAAMLLKEAAGLTKNAGLKDYLLKRAAAFSTNDYYDSDVAWMDLDAPIEITIGPYETYEDRLFGYKAAFEAFVTIKDPEASSRLAAYKNELPAMERNLPIPDEHKNMSRGAESPIGVVDEVFTAGDTRAGVQTIAYNLPNDEKVREAKGSKKILLRNVMDAKFRAILKPIAAEVVAVEQLTFVTAEAFFNETLFHELSHGLGPGKIRVNGRETEARLELKELYSAIEEAKADVMGAFNILYMIGRKQLPESARRDLAVTFAAGMFRSVRFGIEEAHGKGVALQYNYLKEKGAFVHDPATGRFSVDFAKFETGIGDLVHDLCMAQALGDYAAAKRLLDTYAKVPDELQSALSRLKGIPVDIRPIYPAAGETE